MSPIKLIYLVRQLDIQVLRTFALLEHVVKNWTSKDKVMCIEIIIVILKMYSNVGCHY